MNREQKFQYLRIRMAGSPDVASFVAAGPSIDEQLEPFQFIVVQPEGVRFLSPSTGALVVFELVP